jgi:predicted TIM-barrel enzyme
MSSLPSSAACPGAAFVKCTWYTSVAAGEAGFVCANEGAAAKDPPKTMAEIMMDFIDPPRLQ